MLVPTFGVALLLITSAAVSNGQSTPRPDLTCSPAPCVLTNVQVSQSVANTAPDLVLNPSNPLALLSGSDEDNCAAVHGSRDAGSTWSDVCALLPVNPAFAYGPNNTAYAAGFGTDPKCGLDCDQSVGRFSITTDNGVTWSKSQVVIPNILGFSVDSADIEVDNNRLSPYYGGIYISATQFGGSAESTITVSRSKDGGATWQTVAVDSTQNLPTRDDFSELAVGADGSVYVVWMRCDLVGLIGCPGQPATLWFSKSTNGGTSWSSPLAVSTVQLLPNGPGCGSYPRETIPNTSCTVVRNRPSIAIDNSGLDFIPKIYTAIYNWTGSFMQVVVATSPDNGTTWGSPVPVAPPSDNHDQFSPWINVNSAGLVGVTWLDRRDDLANVRYRAFAGMSADGGATFFKNVRLAAAPSDPRISTFYSAFPVHNVWGRDTLYAVWQDTRTGTALTWFGGVRIR
jgi:hypothetical protein